MHLMGHTNFHISCTLAYTSYADNLKLMKKLLGISGYKILSGLTGNKLVSRLETFEIKQVSECKFVIE